MAKILLIIFHYNVFSARFLESLTPADVLNLPVNNGTLSIFTNENGGILDDLILSKTDQDKIYVVTNADCTEKDLSLLQVKVF